MKRVWDLDSNKLAYITTSIIFLTTLGYLSFGNIKAVILGYPIIFTLAWLYNRIVATEDSKWVIYLILLLPTIFPLFKLHFTVGFSIYFVVGITLLYSHTSSVKLVIFTFVYLLGTLLNTLYDSTPIVSPDAVRYFRRVSEDFPNLISYFYHLVRLTSDSIIEVNNVFFTPSSVYDTFPILYLPIYKSFELGSPLFILVLNTILWISTAFMMRDMTNKYLSRHIQASGDIVFYLLMISPTAMYYSSSFLKDITAVFLVVLSLRLYLEKRYLLFVVVIVFSTTIRLYSFAITGIYFGVLTWTPHILLIGIGISTIFMLWFTKEVLTIFNTILMVGYFFISPNPFELQNWMNIEATPRILEGLMNGVFLTISVILGLGKRTDLTSYFIISLGLIVYGLIMSTIGFNWTVNFLSEAYNLGTLGEHIIRKKLPVVPLIAIWISFTYTNLNIPQIKFKI
ncbi:hypothetical protein [Halorubrum ruber]|uniref:Uncharacterized protein n=1 Tax=Halorubrum ruber TaxID=2982524 RepID=A0A8T8LKV9_9EURY|nr:hypothetical protein [Halorubrum ruber]QUO47723.1 hypothetical protein J7656_14380 [Halorubrum ruber]